MLSAFLYSTALFYGHFDKFTTFKTGKEITKYYKQDVRSKKKGQNGPIF